MQKSKAIKETLETIVTNLEKQRNQVESMIDDVEMRIKKNKEAGNVLELNNLSSTEKNEVEKFIKENIEEDQSTEKNYSTTTAKKLMPKMKDKV